MDLIYFDQKAAAALDLLIKDSQAEHKTLFLLCDTHTRQHCLPIFEQFFPVPFAESQLFCLPPGEASKTIENATLIWQQLIKAEADKQSVLFTLGGGVMCDLGGFAAATYKRGIDHILVPTTLLAQTDAALGRKNAVNAANIKNSVGLFTRAKGVYIFPRFLKTLPDTEILSGFAEMLKYGLIEQKSYWDKLKQVHVPAEMIEDKLIFHAVNIKMNICRQDMFEQSIRQKLNFGHSIGHAIEAYFLSLRQPIGHGQAIAEGMIAEAYISYDKKRIERQVLMEIVETIRRFFPPLPIPRQDYGNIIQHTRQDKKYRNGKTNFVLLTGIGNALTGQQVTEEEMLRCLTFREE
jgi:3-dehydroquinate synthase